MRNSSWPIIYFLPFGIMLLFLDLSYLGEISGTQTTFSVTEKTKSSPASTFSSLHSQAKGTCRYQDSLALAAIFTDYFSDADWPPGKKWDLSKNLDTWEGVFLDPNGCVYCLDLDGGNDTMDCQFSPGAAGLGLNSNIPDFNLPELKILILANNEFQGTIPDFSGIPKVTDILLTSNKVNGPLPNFSGMPQLRVLQLRDNPTLGGNITSFAPVSLPELKVLNLRNCGLDGSVADFPNCPQLEVLDLRSNNFTNSLPLFSQNLNIRDLYLQQNNLNGLVPSYSHLDSLKSLNISRNQFTFEDIIPTIDQWEANQNFFYQEQDSVFENTIIQVEPGSAINISLGFDESVDGSDYNWYKDNGGSPKLQFSSAIFSIEDVKVTDAGVYCGTVTNASAPELVLYTRCITVQVAPPSQCIVTNTNDSGPGSLRAAISCANQKPGPDTVLFQIAGNPPYQIKPVFGQYELTDDGTVIDARTQPDWAPGQVVIDGVQLPKESHGLYVNNANDAEIYGLTIRQAPTHGIYLQESNKGKIGDCEILNSGDHGIAIMDGQEPKIERNTIHYSKSDGIWLSNAPGAIVRASESTDNGIHGITIDQSDNTIIENSQFVNNGLDSDSTSGSGILIFASSNVAIRNNKVNGNLKEAGIFVLNGSSNVTITDCEIMDNLLGIWLGGDGASDNFIAQNEIGANLDHAVLISGNSNNNTVIYNHFFDNDDNPVMIENGTGNFIAHNVMEANMGHGVRLTGGNLSRRAPTICEVTAQSISGFIDYPGILHLYRSYIPSDYCQSFEFLDSLIVSVGGSWTIAGSYDPNLVYLASGTDLSNNTSEFTCSVSESGGLFAQSDSTLCRGDSLTIRTSAEWCEYRWSTGATSAEITVKEGGTYGLTVANCEGCMFLDEKEVDVLDLPLANAGEDQILFCNEEVNLQGEEPVNGLNFKYFWSTDVGDITANQGTLTPTVRGVGNYILGVTNTDTQCSASDIVLVTEQPYTDSIHAVPNAYSLNPGQQISFDVLLNDSLPQSGGFQIEVIQSSSNGVVAKQGSSQFTYLANTDFIGRDSFLYEVCNLDCLEDCDQAWVYLEVQSGRFEIEVIITPNGDGIDDDFAPDILQDFPDNHFTVFNRWGSMVYEAKSYTGGWLGTNVQGKDLPEGAYYFILRLALADDQVRYGIVYVVR